MKHFYLALITVAVLSAGCTSTPKPTGVDDSKRQPANTAGAVELQVCKADLQNTRVALAETTRLAERSSAQAAALAIEQQRQKVEVPAVSTTPNGNRIYTVLFPAGSSGVDLADDAFNRMRGDAFGGAWVVIRGRTDGERLTAGEARIALERAAKVQAMLVTAGVDSSKIQISYQPVGDHAASQATAQGRAQNRRVEVEVYATKPTRVVLNKPAV